MVLSFSFLECRRVEDFRIMQNLAVHKHCGTETAVSALLPPRLYTGKGKAIPSQAWTGPYGSRG
jgi:hypothetical protein